jgi:hypothetical protein
VPDSLGATNITSGSANFSWENVPEAINFTIRFKDSATVNWSNLTISSSSITIANLNPCTTYEFQIEALCDGLSSTFSDSHFFTTEGCSICEQPSGVQITEIASTSVKINWDLEPNALATQIQRRIPPALGGGGMATTIANAGTTSKVLSGLLPSTQYQSRLRHSCGINGFSPWRFRSFLTGSSKFENDQLNLSLYPNPVGDVLILDLKNHAIGKFEVEIYDVMGRQYLKKPHSYSFFNSIVLLNEVSNLEAGVYFVCIKSTNFSISHRFLKLE